MVWVIEFVRYDLEYPLPGSGHHHTIIGSSKRDLRYRGLRIWRRQRPTRETLAQSINREHCQECHFLTWRALSSTANRSRAILRARRLTVVISP